MHLIGSLIKLNRISEVLMHGRFSETFIKSWKFSLVTYKNMWKFQAVPTRVLFPHPMFSLILPSPFFFFLPRYLSTGWVCDIRSRSKTAGIEQDDQNQPDRSGQPDTVLWILCLARIRLWRCQLLHQRGILPEDPLRDLCLMREGGFSKVRSNGEQIWKCCEDNAFSHENSQNEKLFCLISCHLWGLN